MTTNQTLENFVPVYDVAPEEPDKLREFLVEQLKRISNAVNEREVGQYQDVELLAGKQFIPGSNNPQLNRQVLRKVIDCGTLPNTGSSTVPHEISFTTNFTLIHLYGSATDPTALTAVPLPYASNTASSDIELSMNATNIVITTAADYSSYTRTYVVCEYIQEV